MCFVFFYYHLPSCILKSRDPTNALSYAVARVRIKRAVCSLDSESVAEEVEAPHTGHCAARRTHAPCAVRAETLEMIAACGEAVLPPHVAVEDFRSAREP